MRMFAPNVSMRFADGSPPALRTIRPTLELAKQELNSEVERAGKPPLEWRDEFGGAAAEQADLRYEVLPVDVNPRYS